MTMPRLELCGALIVAHLLQHVSSILHIPAENTFARTDSRVLLRWLRGDPRQFKPVVGNRASEVLEFSSPNSWSHITEKDNTSDCASWDCTLQPSLDLATMVALTTLGLATMVARPKVVKETRVPVASRRALIPCYTTQARRELST